MDTSKKIKDCLKKTHTIENNIISKKLRLNKGFYNQKTQKRFKKNSECKLKNYNNY